ncbi:MAG TPA: bifunctional (p)ppGpp synthetase/guanosine-3',5'-bis(diphosphate) 3'-pyrophosphohydrolase [Candidatus Spyradocola merdavium]|nr:bifunctional (p)ppGpp synthetase/guanosine-3',5'-bis(diphosphate) 3'-pyrophosphohydrolase [Candidatus Spyradocola merdavium]
MRAYEPKVDGKTIHAAFDYALKMHGAQARESGEPYVVHPLKVAEILADMEMDQTTIVAALLHDCIEDTKASYDNIEQNFGADVARLVDGVTKLDGIEFRTKDEQKAESLRKMFFAMAKDIRVVIIKLADRLHNMRTLKFCNEAKRVRTAKETIEVYAPLANRLGINSIKWELEDLCLRYLDPESYYDLVDRVSMRRQERMEAIDHIIDKLPRALDDANIKADITGRPKHFYSIYKKMKKKGLSFEQIYDLIAVRVLVNTKEDCYAVLGIVHSLWKPMPGRFKDYIARPKANGYQSLHSTLLGDQGMPFEVQIRTHEMHRVAEYGVAAHYKYKNGGKSTQFDETLNFVHQLMNIDSEVDDTKEFMETLKKELFSDDEVFVFTPKGDAIDLPKDSTPLDFAYRIHSAVGNKCVGAKVNQRIVTLDTKLQTGDIVEILTSPSSKGPSMDWLKIVKTTEAKSKIRAYLKASLRDENILLGRDMIEKEARRQNLDPAKLLKAEYLEKIQRKQGFKTADDIYAAVGFGGMTAMQVVMRLNEEYKRAAREEAPLPPEPKPERPSTLKKKQKKEQAVFVKGEEGMVVRFAHCCNPVPGDDIVGYITRGRGVSVHRKDCINLKDASMENVRMIEVSWNTGAASSFNADVQLIAYDRSGIIASLTTMIAGMNIPLLAISARTTRNKTTVINLTLEVKDKEQLSQVMKQFQKNPDIIEAYRSST